MRIGIVGIGAMGCLFAARLNNLAELVMIGHWSGQLNALVDRGLMLIHHDGSHSRHVVKVSRGGAELEAFDMILFLVKSWQTRQAAEAGRDLLKADGLAVTLQNGLGNLEILAANLGSERAVQGVTSEGATLVEPGVVRHAGAGITYLSTTEATQQKLSHLADLFRKAGFESHLTENPDSLIWGKLAINAGINPLTGLLQRPNGYLATNEHGRAIMEMAAKEVEKLAYAQDISLPFDDAAEQALLVARATATNRSSMAQDIARGAPTEIESICGAIIQIGRDLAISTPYNVALYQLIKIQIQGGNWLRHINELETSVREEFQSLVESHLGSKI